jgi:hypothetical protein
MFYKMIYFSFRAEDWSKLTVIGWRDFNHVLGVGILGRVSGSFYFTHFTRSDVCVSLSACSLFFHFYLKKLSNFLSSYLAICLDKSVLTTFFLFFKGRKNLRTNHDHKNAVAWLMAASCLLSKSALRRVALKTFNFCHHFTNAAQIPQSKLCYWV